MKLKISFFLSIIAITYAKGQQTVMQTITMNSNGVNSTEIIMKKQDNINHYSLYANYSGFGLYNSTTQKVPFHINSSDFVGIGTIDPEVLLNVNVGPGGVNGLPGFRIGSINNYPSLELGIENDYDAQIKTYGNDLKIYAGHWKTVGSLSSENHKIDFYTNKIGSADWSTAKMTLNHEGNLGIGTTMPQEKLSVNGKIRAKEIKVETANWPDYVFKENYRLPDLKETAEFIKANKHLPGVPSAAEAEKEGIELGEMNKILLKKIEELTLHLIEKDKKMNDMEKRLKQLENKK